MASDLLAHLSETLADAVSAAAPRVVAIRSGRRERSGILWRPDVVVTSEQVLPDQEGFSVVQGGEAVPARLAGRDPGTNVAVLKLDGRLAAVAPDPVAVPLPRVGALVMVLGATDTGGPAARLGIVHSTGPAWYSEARGRIDALLRLDARLGSDEGGPVLNAHGELLGMSTSGPRQRALVIPIETVARVLEPLLRDGRVPRGWLGVALQPVAVPEALRQPAGQDAGMMVMAVAAQSPAEQAGLLQGDILLDVDGIPVGRTRGVAAALAPERIGHRVALRLLRAGETRTLSAVVAARQGK